MNMDCIFCSIRNGEIAGDIIYSDHTCFAIRDIAPKAPTHVLVIPNDHFTYLTGLTSIHYPMIGRLFEVAKTIAEREGVIDSGYRIVINQGEHSGQVVPHLHLHLLGGSPLKGLG